MDENQAFPIVDIHCNGTFMPNPLVYFALEIVRVKEGANDINFSDFIKYVEKLIDFQCKHVHFCLPEVRLSEALHTLKNDCDYSEFREVANAQRQVNVYINHNNEPLFDWIEKEEPDIEELQYLDEDVDSVLEDGEKCEHEEDDSVISSKRIFKRTYNDHFLNKLCSVKDEDCNELPAVNPRHDATQEWKKMEPKLVGHNKHNCPKRGPSEAVPSKPRKKSNGTEMSFTSRSKHSSSKYSNTCASRVGDPRACPCEPSPCEPCPCEPSPYEPSPYEPSAYEPSACEPSAYESRACESWC
ncbi:unnamed protein product [Lactuca virosa]|uniref:Uncharacterized protein n=1 Tax=Lactuca virosa TaxID=75947 RepID=A0AAU9P073_9ASTR|nr:unnamed protein product [Lactuca virosa]